MINHILTDDNAEKKFLDVRTFRGLKIDIDHYFVQGVIHMKTSKVTSRRISVKINTTFLNDPINKRLYQIRINIISEATPKI